MDNVLEHITRIRPLAFLGLLVCLLAYEAVAPAWQNYQQSRGGRIWHGLRNLLLGAVNSVLVATLFVGLWMAAIEASAGAGIGLLRLFELPETLRAIIAIVVLDFWTYLWHRMNHSVPFFWRFHRVHHSDTQMDVTTATRFHAGEIVMSSLLRIPVLCMLGPEVWHLALYELMMFSVVQFHHANIRIPAVIDRALRILIVTPAMHRVHHSRQFDHQRSNYTSFLSVWDRIFGTYVIVPAVETLHLGVDGIGDERLLGIITAPATLTTSGSGQMP